MHDYTHEDLESMKLSGHDRYSGSATARGACPICGGCDGYLTAGQNRWYVCQRHRAMWFGTLDVPDSGFANETDLDQRRRWVQAEVDGYSLVMPIQWRNVRPTAMTFELASTY